MFVDASALIAILPDEAETRVFVARLERAQRRITAPSEVSETAVAVARIFCLPIPGPGTPSRRI